MKTPPAGRGHGIVISRPPSNLARFVHPSRVIDPEEPHRILAVKQTPGRDVRVTPTVRQFAKQFKKPRRLEDVQRVVAAVRDQIEWTPASIDEALNLYARRTAEDIIHSRRALILGPRERKKLCDIRGCVDYGIALDRKSVV